MNPTGATTIRIRIEVLRAAIEKELETAGVPRDNAQLIARCLIDAECRGHASHGLLILETYLERIAKGGIRPKAVPRTIADDGLILRIDAAGGPGQVAAEHAAGIVARRSIETGIAVATIANNNHVGMMASYRHAFQEAGTLGLLLNISGPSLSPPGGRKQALGSNAICLVVPRRTGRPFCIDFGTGIVALGKIRALLNGNERVPRGWLLDKHGRWTGDAGALLRGGTVPVFGGYKGVCTTLIVEVLAGVLAANTVSMRVNKQRTSPELSMGCSQFFVGLSPARFGAPDLETALDDLQSAIAKSYQGDPPAIWFPDQAEEAAEADGIDSVAIPVSLASRFGLLGSMSSSRFPKGSDTYTR